MTKRFGQETKSRRPRQSSITAVEWTPCSGKSSCPLCDRWRAEEKGAIRGGSRKRGTKRGRPSAETMSSLQMVCPALCLAFDSRHELLPFLQHATGHITCPICTDVLDKPMEVPRLMGCQHPCCQKCWEYWLQKSKTCPLCRCAVEPDDLQPVSRYFQSLLSSLKIRCGYAANGCESVMKLCEQ